MVRTANRPLTGLFFGLALVGLAMAHGILALVSSAPNRLLSGHGVPLADIFSTLNTTQQAAGWLLLAVGCGLALVSFSRSAPRYVGTLNLIWLVLITAYWVLLAGRYASVMAADNALARTSFSAGFWLWLLLAWLFANEALRQRQSSIGFRLTLGALVAVVVGAILHSGAIDQIASVREYNNRAPEFWSAVAQHLQIVGGSALLTLLLGLPLGAWLHRHPLWAARVLVPLSLIQTVPSIALFGLLMSVLAWLGGQFSWLPALGIKGIGMAPAVLALAAYALLPLVRSMYEGLRNLPAGVVEAGIAMGFSARQLLWRVELPLALPVMLAGLKVMLVQSIGMAAVAALIGAGGLGALMFEGLFSSALDLVLLAVIPMVILAWLTEGLFRALTVSARFRLPTAARINGD